MSLTAINLGITTPTLAHPRGLPPFGSMIMGTADPLPAAFVWSVRGRDLPVVADDEGRRPVRIPLGTAGFDDTANLEPGVLDRLSHPGQMDEHISGIGDTAGDDHPRQIRVGSVRMLLFEDLGPDDETSDGDLAAVQGM